MDNPYYEWAERQPDEILEDIVREYELGEAIRTAAQYELDRRKAV